MRQVTQKAVAAFMEGRNFQMSNTSVEVSGEGVTRMRLHGNLIAMRPADFSRRFFISNAGWFSNTTKERLNGLPGVNICQKKGVWYLNGKEWDGNSIEIS